MRKDKTTIQISVGLKTRLCALKAHPRQGYSEVIENLVTEHDLASSSEVQGGSQ
jgi:hypothetical protein